MWGGSGSVPALLCESGFSSHGTSVRTSASETFALSPYTMSGSLIPTWSRTEPTSTYPRNRWTVTKYHGKGYQLSTLKNPVNICTSAEETRIAMLARSTACLIDLTGGNRKRLGYTLHSLTSSSGMVAVPVATWIPWVSR